MWVGLPQGLLSVALERVRVGAQYLGQAAVVFDVGPHRDQRVGGRTDESPPHSLGQRIAGGSLNELVDTNGLVGVVRGVFDEAQPVQGS